MTIKSVMNAFDGSTSTFARSDGTAATPAGGPGGEAFPVGSVFLSVVATDPATLLGYGTWAAIGAGRVLVGRDALDPDFDTLKETGGSKTASHTHTYSDVINHTHPVAISDPGHTHTQTTSATDGASGRADASSGGTVYNNVANINAATTGITAVTTTPVGGVATGTTAASAPSTVQPYLVVNIWERTA